MPRRPKFSYHPLQSSNEIRIVEIRASTDAIYQGLPVAKLIHTELGNGVPFSALSYVWGTEIDPIPLICDGGIVWTTENLGQALRHLQIYGEPRCLWIDALCIDQKNTAERNQQVTLMKDIYGTAKEVLVWLGPDLGSKAKSIFSDISGVLTTMIEDIRNDLEPRQTADLKQMLPLFRSEWFTRTWTIQEAGLTDSPLAVWGKSTINLNKICLAGMAFLKYSKAVAEELGARRLHYILHQARPHQASDPRDKVYAFMSHPTAFDDASDFGFLREDQNMPENFDDTLAETRNLALILSPGPPIKNNDVLFGCILAEDLDHELRPPSSDFLSARRMLGWRSRELHGLRRYHAGGQSFIKPDYNHSLVTVYRDLAHKIIERSNSLEILSFVQHDGPLAPTGPDFPSWLPRWDTHTDMSILGKVTCDHLAAANRRPEITPTSNAEELTVRGIFADRIDIHTGPLTRDDFLDPSLSPVFEMVRTCQVHTHPVPAYPRAPMGNPDRLRAYHKTWTAGYSSTAAGEDPDWLAYQEEYLKQKLYKGKCSPEEMALLISLSQRRAGAGDAKRFANAAAEACHRRSFFVTEHGFFGIGPSIMEEKDIVAVLLGSDVPFILRERSRLRPSLDGYLLIGECYLHGIMAGEAVRAWSEDLRDIKLC